MGVAFTASLTEPPQKAELNGLKNLIICSGYLTVEEQRIIRTDFCQHSRRSDFWNILAFLIILYLAASLR